MNPRDQKLNKLLAYQERRRRQSSNPLRYIKWHEGQQRAIVGKKEKRGLLLNSGNRWGKTTLNGALCMVHAKGYWIWDVPDLELTVAGDYPDRSEISPKYWIRRPDGVPIRTGGRGLMLTGLNRERGIGGILFPALEEVLPPAIRRDLKIWRGPSSVPTRLRFPDGAEIYFGSAEQDPMSFEGMNFDWVACDEPPPKAVWGAVWRGLADFLSPFWFTMTPLGRNAPFVYEEFVAKDRDDVSQVHGSIWDNPYIPHEAKVAFLRDGNYTEEEEKARESGAWSFLSHRAFPGFDPAAHLIDTRIVPVEWPKMLICDPAHRRPFALVWIAFGPNGEREIYDEWPAGQSHSKMRSSTHSIADYATLIRNREGPLDISYRVLDPRFGVAEHSFKGQKHTSVQEDFRRFGLIFDCRVPDTGREETGIERIRGLLRWDRKSPLGPANRPKLQVQRHCINSIEALSMSNFVPPNVREIMILPEKLQELYKDFRDCIRYGILYPRPLRVPPKAYLKTRDFQIINDVFSG